MDGAALGNSIQPCLAPIIAGTSGRGEGKSSAVAGFEAIGIGPTRVYQVDDAREFLAGKGLDVDAIAAEVDAKFMSAFVRARKPGQAVAAKSEACCAPGCCA